MRIDLKTWGPMTVLAVIAVVLVLGGGVVNVIVDDHYTYRAFIDDVKYLVAALAGAVGVGRGLSLFSKR